MKKHDAISFDNLPEAVQHLLKEVAYIKNHLLNDAATGAETIFNEPEKDILTVSDVCKILDLEKGTVYNLTHKQQIPHFKNRGRIYFDRGEIDDWIRRDRRKTLKQLQDEADNDLLKK